MKIEEIIVCYLILLFASCQNDPNKKEYTDTPTSGEIHISVDETFAPLLDTEVFTFENLYTSAKINTYYTNEAKAVENLMNDSSRLVVVSRKLTENEKEGFKRLQLFPKETKVAIDALALIINRKNNDSTIKYSQLIDIFAGKITKWNQLFPKEEAADLKIVFDNKNFDCSFDNCCFNNPN